MVFGKFVFVKSNLGTALYLGNNEKAEGRYYKQVQKEIFGGVATSLLSESERYYVRHVDEVSRNAFHLRKAITFIMEHPFRFVQLTLERVCIILDRHPGNERVAGKSGGERLFFCSCLCNRWFLVESERKPWRTADLPLVLLSFPLLYYFTIVGIYRYRFPIEPILMIFSGYAIHRILCQKDIQRHIPLLINRLLGGA